MRSLVCSLVLCCFAAGSASAGDSAETLWQRQVLCDQFVVEHPYPAIFWDLTGFVGPPDRVGNRVHDCRFDAQHPQ
jgi:hypothetical protein